MLATFFAAFALVSIHIFLFVWVGVGYYRGFTLLTTDPTHPWIERTRLEKTIGWAYIVCATASIVAVLAMFITFGMAT